MEGFGRYRFIKEMHNSRPAWAVGIAYAILSILSTLSFLFPGMSKYVPRWPWYVWVIGFLAIGLIAIFEGAYRQGVLLWRLTDPGQLNAAALINSSILAERRVYPQHFDIELKEAFWGFAWPRHSTRFLFIRAIISCQEGARVKSMGLVAVTDIGRYDCVWISDLRDWFLRTSTQEAQLESLWAKLETAMLHREPMTGWLCFEIPEDYNYNLACLKLFRLHIEDAKGHVQHVYRYNLAVTRQDSNSIIHADFRRRFA
jgi:hypothetical protein